MTTDATPASRRATASAEPFDRLRDDVRLLGELVGEVLREQGGSALFDAVERLRTAAIELRDADEVAPAREAAVLEWLRQQSTARLLQLVRAFSVYFHVINLAEQHHRIRTLAKRACADGQLPESAVAALLALREAGMPEVERGALRDAIYHSINGLAAGLQTTG